MKAIIIYEDKEFAARACATLHRVACHEGIDVQWTVECWPTTALNETEFAEMSLLGTRDAHLIILPASYTRLFPQWLRDWLNRWAGQRQNHEAALAFIDDRNTAGFPHPVCPELSVLIRKHGLNLILGRNPAPADAKKLWIDFSPAQEVSLPVGGANFPDLITHGSYRGMGINE
jgi:hypothetical protein